MVKEKTLTIELSHENPLGDGYFYAMLDLPAEEYEIRDAIQRARMIGREESFRSIGILDCGAWPELLYYRLDSPTIDELNFFANRIAQMDDSELAIFRTVAPKVLGSPADDLLSMKDLINCTYGYDEIMVASNIRTDEQLGQFIIENELHDDVNNIPESSLYLLDKAKIGALYRTSLNCDLTDGYAIFAGDYKPPEIYDGKQLPETAVEDWYAFRLQISPPPTEDVSEVEDKAVWITLPMARQAADRIARELGVGSIEECVYLDFESSVPQITAEQFGDMQLFDKLNRIAEKLPYPTCLCVCWTKGVAWLMLRYDLADDGVDLSEFEQGVADFGIRKCEDVDQFNALLKDLGEDAYDIGYIPPEEDETETMNMGGI